MVVDINIMVEITILLNVPALNLKHSGKATTVKHTKILTVCIKPCCYLEAYYEFLSAKMNTEISTQRTFYCRLFLSCSTPVRNYFLMWIDVSLTACTEA
jgi:hypothetical protein